MATLGGTSSTGETNWEKYVQKNTSYSSVKYEIEDGIVNEPVYVNLTSKKVIDYVNARETINIISTQLTQSGQSKYARIKLSQSKKFKTGYIRITTIRKPTSRESVETRVLQATNETIRKLKVIAGIGPNNPRGIDILVPGIGMIYGVNSLEKEDSTIHGRQPKSDFVFKNSQGKNLLYISHKKGTTAGEFSQYGGVSTISGNEIDALLIYNHSQVQKYLNKLYILYSDAISASPQIKNNPFDKTGKLTKALYSLDLTEQDLVNMAVYGPNYGKAFGPSNVHLIGQGNFLFDKLVNEQDDIYFKLSFDGSISLNGNVDKFLNNESGYRAIFVSKYTAARSTNTSSGKIPQVRTGIYPKAYGKNATSIDDYFPK